MKEIEDEKNKGKDDNTSRRKKWRDMKGMNVENKEGNKKRRELEEGVIR